MGKWGQISIQQARIAWGFQEGSLGQFLDQGDNVKKEYY
jgi:hypothetical protein